MIQRETITVSRDVINRVQVGKSYRFNGRVGRVIAKHEDGAGSSAAGWSSCIPMITVIWK